MKVLRNQSSSTLTEFNFFEICVHSVRTGTEHHRSFREMGVGRRYLLILKSLLSFPHRIFLASNSLLESFLNYRSSRGVQISPLVNNIIVAITATHVFKITPDTQIYFWVKINLIASDRVHSDGIIGLKKSG